ncbi:C-X-C chemokine receptor type 2-like [Hypanus sabinus]|uniref:C-X-C chemokine receptor type 2-like n=1 Tax=Hypanus sabinus TaxID=79690 RepID=UPI0028C3FA6B|nr:C-X-C chemokine receptor type 2-like [Hypanus sabinus]XP_059822108.1 C-X-C chemokine receptor type 2-like [Hypanus sabinus]
MDVLNFDINDKDFGDMFDNYSSDDAILDENSSPCHPLILGNWVNVMLAIVYSLVCFLAVTGNLVVMIVILHNWRSTSSTDIYLLHLATADLLFAVSLPFWAVDATSGWVFGDAMCKVVSMLQEVNFYSGILLLACISVDRYFAIVHSTQYHRLKRPILIKLVCAIVWMLAVLLSLPILYKGKFDYYGRVLCYELLEGESIAIWKNSTRFLRHIIGFLIPLDVMVFCYSVTILRLCQTKGFQKQKAMKVIIAVVLAFLICWLPHNITVSVDTLIRSKLIAETCDRRNLIDRALSVTRILGFLHCCINPILYGFIGLKFRRNLLNLLADKGLISQHAKTHYKRSASSSSESGFFSSAI